MDFYYNKSFIQKSINDYQNIITKYLLSKYSSKTNN